MNKDAHVQSSPRLVTVTPRIYATPLAYFLASLTPGIFQTTFALLQTFVLVLPHQAPYALPHTLGAKDHLSKVHFIWMDRTKGGVKGHLSASETSFLPLVSFL